MTENYNEEFVLGVLKNLGLNSYERQIYAVLLKYGSATSSQITELTTVPRARTYDVMTSLEAKGYTKMLPTKPKKFMALHPTEVVENIKNNLEEEYKNKMNKITEFSRSDELSILSNSYDAK